MKEVLLIYLFIISGFYGYTQDTIYIGEFGSKVVTSKSEAKYYQIITKDNNDKNIYFENTYYLNDTLFRVNKYFDYYDKKRELLEFKTYYRSGNQHIISSFENGKVNGDFISFWENGKTKRIDTYKKGKFIEGHCWDEMGKEVPYYKFEIDAQFSGGNEAMVKYLKENADYAIIPENSKGKQVRVSFYINSDGSIEDVKLVSGVDPVSNFEAIRLIMAMPKWQPAYQDGIPVRVKRTLPLTF